MCFIGSGCSEVFHKDLALIDNMRTLFGSQRRGGARAYELIIMIVNGQECESKKVANLEEECSSEACPNEEKVWRVRCVANRMHIVQPQINQVKRGFHALYIDH